MLLTSSQCQHCVYVDWKAGINKDQIWFASVHRIYQILTPQQHQLLLPLQMYIAVLGGVQIGYSVSVHVLLNLLNDFR